MRHEIFFVFVIEIFEIRDRDVFLFVLILFDIFTVFIILGGWQLLGWFRGRIEFTGLSL